MIATQPLRVTASSGAVGALIAVLALQAFDLSPGVRVPDRAVGLTGAVARAVDQQEATGLRCRVEPALTDTVVLRLAPDAAEVVTFDQAVAATRAGRGVIARYCV